MNTNQQFVTVPNKLVEEEEINPKSLVIYCAIKRYMNKDNLSCYPSLSTIAEKSGCSVPTVKNAIDELVKYVERFEKTDVYLRNPKWVEGLCNNGKLEDAYERATSYGEQGPSYSNVWKAIKYVGIKE